MNISIFIIRPTRIYYWNSKIEVKHVVFIKNGVLTSFLLFFKVKLTTIKYIFFYNNVHHIDRKEDSSLNLCWHETYTIRDWDNTLKVVTQHNCISQSVLEVNLDFLCYFESRFVKVSVASEVWRVHWLRGMG